MKMKKQGLLTLATASAVALFLGTVLPSHAQDQGQGRRGGQGRGQGRGGGFGGGQFGRGGMMGGGMFNTDPTASSKLMLLQRDDVRSELAISARQREQMEQEQQKAREEMRNNRPQFDFQSLQNLSPEERRAQMEKMREQMQGQMRAFSEQMTTKIEAVLTPAQQKRLSELDLQWRGPLALVDSKVASHIRLTPDQQRQVTNILTEYRTGQDEVRRSVFGNFGPGGRGPGAGGPGQGNPGGGGRPQFNPEEMRARMETMQKEMDKIKKASSDKVVALLSAQQRQAWKSLQGKAFTFRAVN
jgi:exonuclease VII large subunit